MLIRPPTATPRRAPDTIVILESDHAKVKVLLGKLETARSAAARSSLFERVRADVVEHATIEEEIFYPAYRDAVHSKGERKLFFEATEEHHLVTIVLHELAETEPADEAFAAKAKVLTDLVEHHAGEEEDEMFPAARKVLDKEQLAELGARMLARKLELLADSRGVSGARR